MQRPSYLEGLRESTDDREKNTHLQNYWYKGDRWGVWGKDSCSKYACLLLLKGQGEEEGKTSKAAFPPKTVRSGKEAEVGSSLLRGLDTQAWCCQLETNHRACLATAPAGTVPPSRLQQPRGPPPILASRGARGPRQCQEKYEQGTFLSTSMTWSHDERHSFSL